MRLTRALGPGVLALVALVPAQAGAQAAAPAFEIGLSAAWVGGQILGASQAVATRNQVPTGGAFPLFDTESRFESGPGFEAGLGVPIGRRLRAEGLFGFSRPAVRVSITGDAEGAPDLVFTGERVSRFTVEGRVSLELAGGGADGPVWRPYVAAGGGYLRELHEGRALAETGATLHGGGGLRRWLRRGASGRGTAVQVEARLVTRQGGIEIDGRRRLFVSGVAGLILGF